MPVIVECLQVAPPDGHRAPIADQLLRVRSVNTQTPCGGGASGGAGQTLIGRRWRRDDVITGSSPPAVTSAATTSLPVVPPFDEDSDDLDSDEDTASSGESEYIPGGPKKRGQCTFLLVSFKRLDQI